METTKIKQYIKELNATKEGKEKTIFLSENTFKVFGVMDKGVLNPFRDYTYKWLNEFLSNVEEHLNYNKFDTLEEMQDSIQDNLNEWVDNDTDIYTSDLKQWFNDCNESEEYLTQAIKEMNSKNPLMTAQYLAREEFYNNALNILIEDLKAEFEELV